MQSSFLVSPPSFIARNELSLSYPVPTPVRSHKARKSMSAAELAVDTPLQQAEQAAYRRAKEYGHIVRLPRVNKKSCVRCVPCQHVLPASSKTYAQHLRGDIHRIGVASRNTATTRSGRIKLPMIGVVSADAIAKFAINTRSGKAAAAASSAESGSKYVSLSDCTPLSVVRNRRTGAVTFPRAVAGAPVDAVLMLHAPLMAGNDANGAPIDHTLNDRGNVSRTHSKVIGVLTKHNIDINAAKIVIANLNPVAHLDGKSSQPPPTMSIPHAQVCRDSIFAALSINCPNILAFGAPARKKWIKFIRDYATDAIAMNLNGQSSSKLKDDHNTLSIAFTYNLLSYTVHFSPHPSAPSDCIRLEYAILSVLGLNNVVSTSS